MAIITKLYEGNLYDLYIQNAANTLTNDLLLDFSRGTASAVAEMHSLGIVHRDLKSSNLFIEKVANKHRIILGDFGLCKIFGKLEVAAHVKSTAYGLSHRYAAPESFVFLYLGAAIETTADHEMCCDVYAYSIVLWEMLHSASVWGNLSNEEIEFKVRSGERPLICDSIRQDPVKNEMAKLMVECWEPSPERYVAISDPYDNLVLN